jgi:hypothetical protein
MALCFGRLPSNKLTAKKIHMNTLEVLSIIKDISLSVAAGVTAYVALTGLGKWEKELNGKANFDVARELARSVYAVRDGIAYCRSPFTEAQEFPEGYDALGEQNREKEGAGLGTCLCQKVGACR